MSTAYRRWRVVFTLPPDYVHCWRKSEEEAVQAVQEMLAETGERWTEMWAYADPADSEQAAG